ncbi:MAG: acylglycerol kinase family protein, partial [Candidatus Methanomethylophilaceae archaeon]|nr:acylglycerol kinase family protein [Candidatus Methanomethylophilaceae archaeon]
MIGIIYNPTTNKGASVERMKRVREKLDAMGVEYDYRETEYAGHATELAKELAQTCDTIVSAGGDGTLHEILNGTVDLDINYAILPFGSG